MDKNSNSKTTMFSKKSPLITYDNSVIHLSGPYPEGVENKLHDQGFPFQPNNTITKKTLVSSATSNSLVPNSEVGNVSCKVSTFRHIFGCIQSNMNQILAFVVLNYYTFGNRLSPWLVRYQRSKMMLYKICTVLWALIDFFCCSLTNKWLRNVVTVTLHVLSDVFFHMVMAFVTIMITIIVNIEQYRKSNKKSLDDKTDSISTLQEDDYSETESITSSESLSYRPSKLKKDEKTSVAPASTRISSRF